MSLILRVDCVNTASGGDLSDASLTGNTESQMPRCNAINMFTLSNSLSKLDRVHATTVVPSYDKPSSHEGEDDMEAGGLVESITFCYILLSFMNFQIFLY